jgi:hypothetical protein
MSYNYPRTTLVGFAVAAAALGSACGSDIFDVDVDLQRQVYSTDFGATQGTIPVIPCDVSTPEVCGAGITVAPVESSGVRADVQLGCDGTSLQCYAQAHLVGTNAVNVLQDDAFLTKVERRSVTIVRKADLAYQVPVNTLTFDIPQIQIFVGPAGSTSETDTGVVPVGATARLAAAVTLDAASAGHVVVADKSPAHDFIESSIIGKQTMVFLLVADPRMNAGAALPAGALEIDLIPKLTVGF